MPCMPCIFLLRTLCTFQARSKHATYVFFFTLKSDVCFLLGVWGVCADYIHFCIIFVRVVQALYTPCARPCTPMHAPSIKYVRTVFTLFTLYILPFLILEVCTVHLHSVLHALCTLHAHPLHDLSMLEACKACPPFLLYAPCMLPF